MVFLGDPLVCDHWTQIFVASWIGVKLCSASRPSAAIFRVVNSLKGKSLALRAAFLCLDRGTPDLTFLGPFLCFYINWKKMPYFWVVLSWKDNLKNLLREADSYVRHSKQCAALCKHHPYHNTTQWCGFTFICSVRHQEFSSWWLLFFFNSATFSTMYSVL